MYVNSLISKNIHSVYFNLGKCVAGGPRKCSGKFGETINVKYILNEQANNALRQRGAGTHYCEP